MLRSFLLYLSGAKWARRMVMGWGLARRVARRFVAGESEDDVIAAIRAINQKGMTVSVDILGESTTDAAEARRYADSYLHLIERVDAEGLRSSVSLKLTALGLDVDPELCHENMRRILESARAHGVKVTIDMEDHTYTDRTLGLLRMLRSEGFENAQGVIQAYLYRSEEDIAALAGEQADIRLCKGAYHEPADVAYPRKADVDAAYLRLMKTLLDAANHGGGYPGIATHDQAIIAATRAYAAECGIPLDRFEFQMLYGIRPALQEELARAGYGMRVYVPFGTQWYPYFMRRLAERPANLWFFASNLLRG
jgi:proline dehydrogenase